jgi:hypothetical protein
MQLLIDFKWIEHQIPFKLLFCDQNAYYLIEDDMVLGAACGHPY